MVSTELIDRLLDIAVAQTWLGKQLQAGVADRRQRGRLHNWTAAKAGTVSVQSQWKLLDAGVLAVRKRRRRVREERRLD